MPEQILHQLNVVLLGKTGSGKSASGNTILNQKKFLSAIKAKAITRTITKENVTIDGTQLTVYDTPGLFDKEKSNEEILTQWRNDLQLDQSAPTVYLLVIRPERFTAEQKSTVQQVEDFLGERRLNTWILFTRGDELEHEEMTIEEFIEDNDDIKSVVERFGSRYHVFNNREKNSVRVSELIRKIMKSHKGMDPVADIRPTVGKQIPLIQPDLQWPDPAPLPERRLVLLGKTGVGKSASGNTILGENKFHSEISSSSVTEKSEVHQAVVASRNRQLLQVSVVDTPGLFDTKREQEEIILDLARSIYECSPGPHAFLFVLPLTARFTKQEKDVTNMIRNVYGEGALKYTIILFTYGDQLEGEDINKYIDENKDLSGLVNQCGRRYHVFNNNDQRNRRQVTELLDKIDKMIEENGRGYYSNEMLEDAKRCRAEAEQREREQREREQEERKRQEEQQRHKEIERAKRETEGRIRREKEAERRQKQDEIKRAVREAEERTKRKMEEERGFKQFVKRNKKILLIAAVAGGLIGGVGLPLMMCEAGAAAVGATAAVGVTGAAGGVATSAATGVLGAGGVTGAVGAVGAELSVVITAGTGVGATVASSCAATAGAAATGVAAAAAAAAAAGAAGAAGAGVAAASGAGAAVAWTVAGAVGGAVGGALVGAAGAAINESCKKPVKEKEQ